MTPRPDPIVLDSSVLVAYERVRTDVVGAMRATQSRVAGWLLQDILLLLPAQSIAAASSWCGGKLPELDFLLRGDPDLVMVVPLAWDAAVDVGAASAPPPTGEDLEIAHVLWCATGHARDANPKAPWRVATYAPHLYDRKGVPVIEL